MLVVNLISWYVLRYLRLYWYQLENSRMPSYTVECYIKYDCVEHMPNMTQTIRWIIAS